MQSRPNVYPVPDHASALEQQWSAMLAEHFGIDLAQFRASPERFMAFQNQSVSIELMDGSSATFRWAFPLIDERLKAIAVFTEHCGHHVFPYHEARVRIDDATVFDSRG